MKPEFQKIFSLFEELEVAGETVSLTILSKEGKSTIKLQLESPPSPSSSTTTPPTSAASSAPATGGRRRRHRGAAARARRRQRAADHQGTTLAASASATLLSSTYPQPAKDSTDLTLAGMDALENVEVDEELFSSPLEDEDYSDSSSEEDDPVEMPPFCIVCKANSYPPHHIRSASDVIFRKVSKGGLDLVHCIKCILYCDKHTVTSSSPPVV